MRELESSDHLFLHREVITEVWGGLFRWLGFHFWTPPNLYIHWECRNDGCRNERIRKGYRLIWACGDLDNLEGEKRQNLQQYTAWGGGDSGGYHGSVVEVDFGTAEIASMFVLRMELGSDRLYVVVAVLLVWCGC